MHLNELFIYNETYQLPPADYTNFKSRVDKCSGNPMCLNNVKYDAETFIAKLGKKIGAKIENGEESNYTIGGPITRNVSTSTADGMKINAVKIIILLTIVVLIYLALKKRNMYFGIGAVALVIGFAVGNEKIDQIINSQK